MTRAAETADGHDPEGALVRRPRTSRLPPGLTPRGLTREQAALYCGCGDRHEAFDSWVRRGIVPGPIAARTGGTARPSITPSIAARA